MRTASKKRRRPRSKAAGEQLPEAKVFMSGRSQAVRLPKEFRVAGDTVYLKRLGEQILLIPKDSDRWAGLFAALDEFPRDFNVERNQHQPARPGLENLFKGE